MVKDVEWSACSMNIYWRFHLFLNFMQSIGHPPPQMGRTLHVLHFASSKGSFSNVHLESAGSEMECSFTLPIFFVLSPKCSIHLKISPFESIAKNPFLLYICKTCNVHSTVRER